MASTLLLSILLFILPLLLKFAHRLWSFYNDIHKMLFSRIKVTIGCIDVLNVLNTPQEGFLFKIFHSVSLIKKYVKYLKRGYPT
jgi:hypothetical protein